MEEKDRSGVVISALFHRFSYEDVCDQRVQTLALTNGASRELLCLGATDRNEKPERDIPARSRVTLVLHGPLLRPRSGNEMPSVPWAAAPVVVGGSSWPVLRQ